LPFLEIYDAAFDYEALPDNVWYNEYKAVAWQDATMTVLARRVIDSDGFVDGTTQLCCTVEEFPYSYVLAYSCEQCRVS
jgi:hypothetical protein